MFGAGGGQGVIKNGFWGWLGEVKRTRRTGGTTQSKDPNKKEKELWPYLDIKYRIGRVRKLKANEIAENRNIGGRRRNDGPGKKRGAGVTHGEKARTR